MLTANRRTEPSIGPCRAIRLHPARAQDEAMLSVIASFAHQIDVRDYEVRRWPPASSAVQRIVVIVAIAL